MQATFFINRIGKHAITRKFLHEKKFISTKNQCTNRLIPLLVTKSKAINGVLSHGDRSMYTNMFMSKGYKSLSQQIASKQGHKFKSNR